ncbi:hypothetical protein [Priestia megaterium]|uniref:hypothetical protein n=1 Tax=Priestia megaterium TaxID=1404 RepID=UPI0011BB0515|nr:hypothetical protein [Priestia megaterium]QDZ80160.1 hypothetical protein D0440_12185 [Priestia megaterium]
MYKPIICNVSEKITLQAVHWAAKKVKHSIDRGDMHERDLSEALDHKVMGDIAAIAVVGFLINSKVNTVIYDLIRNDNFQVYDAGWDIAIGKNASTWAKETLDPTAPLGLTTVSVRSSRLPKNDSLETAMKIRDFKIFKKRNNIADDITADIELQVYYNYYGTELTQRTVTEEDIIDCINAPTYNDASCRSIAEKLDAFNRWQTCCLVGFNTKKAIVEYSQKLNKKTWISHHKGHSKEMWIAPLKEGMSMQHLREYNV